MTKCNNLSSWTTER